MNIHEYQAKKILAQYGVPVPRGGVAHSATGAIYQANELGGDKWIVKAQVCLLYTSPSPRDQRGSRMPSSA